MSCSAVPPPAAETSEFALIRRHFTRPTQPQRQGVILGVGDDAAILQPTAGQDCVVSTDMLVAGRHYFADTDPRRLGHKTLAVNLSDIAAMGGTPRWVTLAAALPSLDEAWVAAFAEGLFALADQYAVQVVGGDTTRGPLTLCVHIMGEVPTGQALRRDGAQQGDDIWVSGALGLAAAALAHLQHRAVLPATVLADCQHRLEAPTPRLSLGVALRGLATAAIDVSDGLLADLGHIATRSQLAAEVEAPSLPTHPYLTAQRGQWLSAIAAGGDDYELCFTAPVSARSTLLALMTPLGLPLTRIGRMVAGHGVSLLDATGHPLTLAYHGYDHFA